VKKSENPKDEAESGAKHCPGLTRLFAIKRKRSMLKNREAKKKSDGEKKESVV
jgi:hypothetical protein